MQRARLVAVTAVTLLPVACHEDRPTAPSGVATMTVSSPGAYGQAGVVQVVGPRAASPDLTVAETTTYQSIEGFGGAFNEQGWDALAALDEGGRQQALRLLFGAADGARFRFGRLPIGASDYALDDVPGDYAMKHFSIDRDRARLISYARAAVAVQPALRLWASAWTPPPWLKTNGAYDSGAMREDPEALAAYALYLARFVESYRTEGFTVQAVHVQNEPAQLTHYPSCLWTPELIRDFVRDHLGPIFAARHVPAEIWLGTLNTADPRYASVVLGDSLARRHVRGIGVQWSALAITADLAASYPDLPLMQTETVCGNHPCRYMDALSQVQDPTPAVRDLDALTTKASTKDGRTVRAFNPLSRNERMLFEVLLAGEHALHGFTNRDVRQKLGRTSYPLAPNEDRQPSQVTRLFRRLHAHGLIAKIPRSRRWRVSLAGRRTMSTAIKLREVAYPALFAATA